MNILSNQFASGPVLDVQDLSKAFSVNSEQTPVLSGLSFQAAPGEFICIIGQSGCGKSTLIKLLAGFVPPTSGRILFKGKNITAPGPDRCVVFQEDALFSWLTVAENIGFGLKRKALSAAEKQGRVNRFLDLVGLTEFKNYLPREISGGMKQRVALARVLVLSPEVLLMDEPFAALDAQTREQMQNLLLSLWEQLKQTIVFVTHDVREAVTLADRTMVMGRITGKTIINPTHLVPIPLERPRIQNSREFMKLAAHLKAMVFRI
ncbi:ABC transporter ATP-binding protein [Desulfobacter postgatei]|jgi:NitT/TauT family transport system ATP-binding protein|uniref:ABC transporter ATP-binding protein n=1 Tax=Desulfobacter postgatei TaxID=2293 RepID=UPI002A36EFFC|nr:ABC transporter ATP-binding protein [Desulfobacter postgatei]MDX9963171.1 ABC transporter ATP-binding protein [Desulfobacter postgatei]